MKSARSVRIITGISIAILSISAVSALAFTTVTASIEKIDVFAGLDKRPDKKSSAVNYLIVGSDTREGLTRAEQKALLDESLRGKTEEERLIIKQTPAYRNNLNILREINEQVKEIQTNNKVVVDSLIDQE
jgi:hypothetical protein